MKIINFLLLIVLLCNCSNPAELTDVIYVNAEDEYLDINFNINDLAEIEYIKLYTDSNFISSSRPLVLNDKYIMTKGSFSGEILIFDRRGNAFNKFSHYGSGPHEYNYITNLRMNLDNNEIFIHDVFLGKIFVYDINGVFIREYLSGDARFIYNFSNEEFLCYNSETNKLNVDIDPYYSLICKSNGEIVNTINISADLSINNKLSITKNVDGGTFTYTAMHLPLVRCDNGYFFNDLSSDTIYKYTNEKKLVPFVVLNNFTDSNKDMFLQSGVETSNLFFMNRVLVDENNKMNMFPELNLVYDKNKRKTYKYKIINEDCPNIDIIFNSHIVNCDMESGYGVIRLNAAKLREEYDNNNIHGRLATIVSDLKEEDNDILMLLKFK